MRIVWTAYMKYKSKLRGFNLLQIEDVINSSSERYLDTITGRRVIVGKYESKLILIPYEMDENSVINCPHHDASTNQFSYKNREIYS